MPQPPKPPHPLPNLLPRPIPARQVPRVDQHVPVRDAALGYLSVCVGQHDDADRSAVGGDLEGAPAEGEEGVVEDGDEPLEGGGEEAGEGGWGVPF